MSTLALITTSGWDVTIPSEAEQSRQAVLDVLDAADFDGSIPATELGQSIANEISAALGQCDAFMADVERMSKDLRQPYFEMSKAIKAKGDEFNMPLAVKRRELHNKLAEFEAAKVRAEQHQRELKEREAAQLRREEEARQRAAEEQRQADEKAERDRLAAIQRAALDAQNAKARAECEAAWKAEQARQAQAEADRNAQRDADQQKLAVIERSKELCFEAPKTAGVAVKVAFDFEVENKEQFAKWCWSSGRGHWIRALEFAKRDVCEYLNSDDADRNLPGCRVFQALGAAIKKPKNRTIDVQARVEL